MAYDGGGYSSRYEEEDSLGSFGGGSRGSDSGASRSRSRPDTGMRPDADMNSRHSSSHYDRGASYGGSTSYDRWGSGGNAYSRGSDSYSGRRGESSIGEDYDRRIQVAHRRMEESSGNSLRTLHETFRMGIDTTDELDVQAETLDRVDKHLDEMDVDLDRSKRHMRNIKSPFGGIANYFAKKKNIDKVTDPEMPKPAPKKREGSRGKDEPDSGPRQAGQMCTGNKVVDRNLDEMEKVLFQLRGVGELIGDQLDDSDAQIERIKVKMDRDDIKIKGLNRDIKGQL